MLTALRVDLRFPDVPAATDAAVISRFINALKARIDAYQKRKHREGKRVHPTTLHYVWAREFGECKGKKHYHLMLLVNRDTWCRAGDYRAPGSLAGMIKQAWCSALGVDVGCHATLVHFPAWPAVWLARNDETGFQQVLERAQYPANQKYGLLSGGNDVSTRPLTVFYVSVPLCDNHSAVTATSLLYPNSSPDFN